MSLTKRSAPYQTRHQALFLRDVNTWQSDRRANRAFVEIGARVCG